MMGQDQPNETAVMSQIDKIAQARAELEKANARFLFALRAKLTPEQWKQVQEFRATHDGKRRNWDREGPRHGDGPRHMTPPAAPPPPPGPQGMLDDGLDVDGPAHSDAPPAPVQQ
jgi:hypothetical protein